MDHTFNTTGTGKPRGNNGGGGGHKCTKGGSCCPVCRVGLAMICPEMAEWNSTSGGRWLNEFPTCWSAILLLQEIEKYYISRSSHAHLLGAHSLNLPLPFADEENGGQLLCSVLYVFVSIRSMIFRIPIIHCFHSFQTEEVWSWKAACCALCK